MGQLNIKSRPCQIVICLGLALAGSVGYPAGLRAEGGASYQAVNRDEAMTLPPGAYRASKPIDLNGDFMVKVQPNTQIEGAQFHGRSGVQQWVITGALLRQVAITGKRNANGQATDSAFEDFSFDKDDNWYNFWWSTRWYFENCIFTKKFLRGDLPPLDYSAHATHCTFYGVKLPPVGFKEDSAGYMGKDEMVFEHCRFVDCDVPQTFLASTVDCVFEHCRFEAKNHVVWPKETSPIKVTAYYAGDNAPAAYTNGPFTVDFQREGIGGGGRGSTVPHTQSGGRITLTNLHSSGTVAALGTSPLKSSQLVAAAASPSPSPVALVPAVRSPAALPRTAVAAAANAVLDGRDPAGFVGTWRVIVLDSAFNVERTLGADHSVTENGQKMGSWEIKGNQFCVHIDLGDGVDTFELPARNGTMRGKNLLNWPLSLTRMDAPVAAAVRAQVIGTWDRTDLTLNVPGVVTFSADGLHTYDGRAAGRWKIYGNSLLVNYDGHPEWTDVIELPGASSTMVGVNSYRDPLKLVRHTGAAPVATPEAGIDANYFGHK